MREEIPEIQAGRQTVMSVEFLRALHQLAVRLERSPEQVLHFWGVHLLEDWKSLSLIGEKFR
jgi:hypothetical protein